MLILSLHQRPLVVSVFLKGPHDEHRIDVGLRIRQPLAQGDNHPGREIRVDHEGDDVRAAWRQRGRELVQVDFVTHRSKTF